MLTMPFKKYIDNAAYSLIYMLMLALWILEYFLLSSENLSYSVTLLLFKVFLSSLPLCCFMLYCASKLLIKFWHFCGRGSYNCVSLDLPERLINDDDAYNDNDSNDEDDH